MVERKLLGLRVLVIDDDVDAGDSVAWLLGNAWAETRVARDATDVANLVRSFDPGMVLLDLTLPKVDGYQACRVIRQVSGSTPYIVALTGWGGADVREKCAQAGFDLHLPKPAPPPLLIKLGQLALMRSTHME